MTYEVGGKITLGLSPAQIVGEIDGVSPGIIGFKQGFVGSVTWGRDQIDALIACGAATCSPPVKAPEPVVETFEGTMDQFDCLCSHPEFVGAALSEGPLRAYLSLAGKGYPAYSGWGAHVVVTLTPPKETL